MVALNLDQDVVSLTAALVDIESESLDEQKIADAVETQLAKLSHLKVERDGHTIVARTELGRDQRVVIAGHLDTVPVNGNLPSRLEGDFLYGLGSCDMKGGVAIALRLAQHVTEPTRDITFVFYEGEEIAHEFNGLGRIAREKPELLAGDFAILMEPTDALVEAGCQGTMRFDVIVRGERAHSARSWMGVNAIHAAAPILQRLVGHANRWVEIDGLTYREGLNAVAISGGVSGNVIPDEARVTVNFRFAPDRSEAQAEEYIRAAFDGFEVEVTDSAPAAMPGLGVAAAAAFVEAIGGEVKPKFGWTDVAQFTQLSIPAVNFGPGDPMLAHKAEEHVPVDHLVQVEEKLVAWLTA